MRTENEGRLVFKNGELILINNKEPVIQVAIEMVVMGKIVCKN